MHTNKTQPAAETPPLMLSVEDGAKYAGTGRDFMYQLVHAGRLPHIRVGRKILIPRAAIEGFVRTESRWDSIKGCR